MKTLKEYLNRYTGADRTINTLIKTIKKHEDDNRRLKQERNNLAQVLTCTESELKFELREERGIKKVKELMAQVKKDKKATKLKKAEENYNVAMKNGNDMKIAKTHDKLTKLKK